MYVGCEGVSRSGIGGSTPLLSDLKNLEARDGTKNKNMKLQSGRQAVSGPVRRRQSGAELS